MPRAAAACTRPPSTDRRARRCAAGSCGQPGWTRGRGPADEPAVDDAPGHDVGAEVPADVRGVDLGVAREEPDEPRIAAAAPAAAGAHELPLAGEVVLEGVRRMPLERPCELREGADAGLVVDG